MKFQKEETPEEIETKIKGIDKTEEGEAEVEEIPTETELKDLRQSLKTLQILSQENIT